MKKIWLKSLIAASCIGIGAIPIVAISCSTTNKSEVAENKNIKIAQFNVSFARDNDPTETYDRWVKYMSISKQDQDKYIEKWKLNKNGLSQHELEYAERIIQIRNITAIVQNARPDIILFTEFNNNGTNDNTIMELYAKNYLAYGQSLNSVDGGAVQEPIHYPYIRAYATNTGLQSGYDLNNDGNTNNDPNDAHGFGYYHGHYQFGLMSKYEIDDKNTRTFQKFLWKDYPGAEIPKIIGGLNDSKIPAGMKPGDNWFSPEEWNTLRLSSKNHVDVPVKINNQTVHLLLSHPVPQAFDTVTYTNVIRNQYENQFWIEYINNASWIYDDNGKRGGINGNDEKFIIMGDLNSDPYMPKKGEIPNFGIHSYTNESKIHNSYFYDGPFAPRSTGGWEEVNKNNHPYKAQRTSVFGLRVDYALASSNLKLIDSGVYWKGEKEVGRLLFNDKRVGKYGNSKEVSSDHRLVWSTIEI